MNLLILEIVIGQLMKQMIKKQKKEKNCLYFTSQFETQYTFFYNDIKDNTTIIDGYFLSSLEYKEAILYYKKLDSDANNMEFKLKLSPESDDITIKMNKLKKEHS